MFEYGTGIMFVVLLALCAVGIYAHLWNVQASRIKELKDRMSKAREHMRLCDAQISAMVDCHNGENEDWVGTHGEKKFEWHTRVARDLTASARSWIRK